MIVSGLTFTLKYNLVSCFDGKSQRGTFGSDRSDKIFIPCTQNDRKTKFLVFASIAYDQPVYFTCFPTEHPRIDTAQYLPILDEWIDFIKSKNQDDQDYLQKFVIQQGNTYNFIGTAPD